MKKLKATERTSIIGRRTGVNVVSGRKIRAKEDGTDEFEDYWTESDSEQSTVSVASLASERGRSDDVSQRKSRAVSRSFTKSPGRKSLERSSTRKRKDEEFQDRSCNTSIQEISFRKDVSKTRRDELSINGTRATDDDTANTSLCGVQKSPAKSIQKKRSERFEDDNSDSSVEGSTTRKGEGEEFEDHVSNNSSPENSFTANVSKGRRAELSINGSRATRKATATDGDTANKSLAGIQKSPAKSIQKKRSKRFEDDSSDSSVEGSTTRKGEGEEFEDHVSNNSSPENSFTANVSKGRRAELSINGSRATRKATATDGDTANKSLAGIQKSPAKSIQKKRSERFEDDNSDSSVEGSTTRKGEGEEFEDHVSNNSSPENSFTANVSKGRRAELSINGSRATRKATATDGDTANKSLAGIQKSPAKSIQKKRSKRFEDDSSDSSVEGSTTRKGEGEEFEDHVSNNSSPENSFTANVSKGRRAELSINGSRTTRKATATDGDTANKSLAGIQKSPVKRFEKNRSRSEPFEDGSSDSSLERSTTQKKQNEEIEDHMSNNSSPEKSFTANVSKGRRAELSENRTRATRTAVASDGDTADKNKVRKSPFRRVHKRRSENYEDGSSNCSLERSTAQERNDGEFEDDSSSNSSPEKSFRADDSIVTRAELSKNGIGASRSAVPSDGDAVDKNVSGVQKSPVERVRKRKSVSFKDVSINSRAVSSPNWKRKGEEFEDHGSRPEKSFRTDVSKVIGAELSKNKTRASRNAIESDGDTVDKNLSGVRVSPVERVQKRRSEQFENISSNSRAEPSPTREKKDEEFEDHANNSVPEKSFRANASKVGKAALSVNSRARATRNLFTPDGDTVDKNLTRVRKSPVQRVQKGRSEQFEDASSESSSERSPTRERKDEELENRRSPRLQNSVREKTLRSRGSRVRWADLSENGTGVTRNAVASDGDADDNNLLGIQMSPVESVQKRRTEQFEDACSDSSLERSPTLERKDEELKSVKSNISIREKSFREDVSKVRRAKLSKNGTPSTGDAIAADGDKNLTGVRKSPVKRVMKRRSENFEDGRSNSGSESSLRAEASKRRSTSASSAAENVQLSDNLVASDSAGQPHPTQVPTSSAAKRKKKKKRGFGNKLRSGSSDGKSGVSTHGTVQTPSTSEYAQTSDLVPGTGAKRSSTAQRRIDFSETSDAAEQDQQPGFRRSSRKRIPPVAGWLNARCVPFLKASGDISVVYEEGTKEDSFAVNRLKKKYIRNQTKKKKMKSRGKAKQATTLEKTRVVDERTQKSHNLFIHRPFNLYDWTCPTTTDDRDPAVPYRITKGFSCKTISFGFVDIIAHCTKDPQYSPTDNLHFVVLNGDVDVTISNTLRTHTKYDSFIVPTGASYSITNNGPSNALLSFCTFKAPFFSYQE